jgi:hypothetical protein
MNGMRELSSALPNDTNTSALGSSSPKFFPTTVTVVVVESSSLPLPDSGVHGSTAKTSGVANENKSSDASDACPATVNVKDKSAPILGGSRTITVL